MSRQSSAARAVAAPQAASTASPATVKRARRTPVAAANDGASAPASPGASPVAVARAGAPNVNLAPAPVAPIAPVAPVAPVARVDPIDPEHHDAKARIAARYPRVTDPNPAPSSPEASAAIVAYAALRSEMAALEARQAVEANRLRLAIGCHASIRGEAGAYATLGERKGEIDWHAVAADFGISPETLERYRKPPTRTLLVTASKVGT